jgi:hypothetical protein
VFCAVWLVEGMVREGWLGRSKRAGVAPWMCCVDRYIESPYNERVSAGQGMEGIGWDGIFDLILYTY